MSCDINDVISMNAIMLRRFDAESASVNRLKRDWALIGQLLKNDDDDDDDDARSKLFGDDYENRITNVAWRIRETDARVRYKRQTYIATTTNLIEAYRSLLRVAVTCYAPSRGNASCVVAGRKRQIVQQTIRRAKRVAEDMRWMDIAMSLIQLSNYSSDSNAAASGASFERRDAKTNAQKRSAATTNERVGAVKMRRVVVPRCAVVTMNDDDDEDDKRNDGGGDSGGDEENDDCNDHSTASSFANDNCRDGGGDNDERDDEEDLSVERNTISSRSNTCKSSERSGGGSGGCAGKINSQGKFVYNRILHFQDCIKQFQGNKSCKIPSAVLDQLSLKFRDYNLLVDSTNDHVRYSKITPVQIALFLKELKLTKQYENVNVIYNVLTGRRAADICHLENQLVDDFKRLVALYDSLHGKDAVEELDRKNFMNVQYLLFQLLRRHDYQCKIEDFSVLKTVDRKLFHDRVCGNLFAKLGWKFTPTF